ncbi:MAG: hypothetical protein KA247_01360 [Bacteroidetes bacterium]|nr:hypothetical protein [Bacteroidota bacterium]
MKNIILYISISLIFLSCSDPNERNGEQIYLPPNIQDSTQITDENVIRAVYSTYRYPKSFVTEDFQGASPYYENTISIRRLNERPEYWKELSTNDRNQAFAWSESSSVYSAYYRKLVSERETEKFFEFRRVWEEHPNDAILSRVHKSTYLDRSMCDRLRQRDTIAVFKGAVDTATVKELVEYLWYAGNYNFGGAKVLCTSVFDRGSNIEYHLFHTEVSFGDWDLSDHITVSRSIFRVKKGTGTVNYTKQLLRVVEGKRN